MVAFNRESDQYGASFEMTISKKLLGISLVFLGAIASAETVMEWGPKRSAVTLIDNAQWQYVETHLSIDKELAFITWYLWPKYRSEPCRFGLSETFKPSAIVIKGEVIGVSLRCLREKDDTIYNILPNSELYASRVIDIYIKNDLINVESDIANFSTTSKGFLKIWEDQVAINKFERPRILDLLRPIRIAASEGDVMQQLFLGYCYASGERPCGIDKEVGFKWNEIAARQGNADAQMALGLHYFNGDGVEINESKAAENLLKSAIQGQRAAQYYLGMFYWEGIGVIKDPVSAHMWNNISAANGYEKAKKLREKFELMLTQSQLEEAYRRAKKCTASRYTDC